MAALCANCAAVQVLTQRQAGERVGVRSEFVSKVERGSRGMRWHTILTVLRAYDVGLRELADEIERDGRSQA